MDEYSSGLYVVIYLGVEKLIHNCSKIKYATYRLVVLFNLYGGFFSVTFCLTLQF